MISIMSIFLINISISTISIIFKITIIIVIIIKGILLICKAFFQ
mgnify:CR=1 FL=1